MRAAHQRDASQWLYGLTDVQCAYVRNFVIQKWSWYFNKRFQETILHCKCCIIYRSFVACHLIIPAAATTAVPWRCLHPGFWLSRLAGPPVLWQTSISAFTELRIILVSAVCSNIILMMKIYGRLWLLFFCTSNYNYIELQSNLDITNMGITKFAI